MSSLSNQAFVRITEQREHHVQPTTRLSARLGHAMPRAGKCLFHCPNANQTTATTLFFHVIKSYTIYRWNFKAREFASAYATGQFESGSKVLCVQPLQPIVAHGIQYYGRQHTRTRWRFVCRHLLHREQEKRKTDGRARCSGGHVARSFHLKDSIVKVAQI